MNKKFFKKLLIKIGKLKGTRFKSILILLIIIFNFFLVGLYNAPSKNSNSYNKNLASSNADGGDITNDYSSEINSIPPPLNTTEEENN